MKSATQNITAPDSTKSITIFEELVASEAAMRGQNIIEKHGFADVSSRQPISTKNIDRATDKASIAQALAYSYVKIYAYQFQDSSQHRKKDKDNKRYNARHLTEDERATIQRIFRDFVDANYDDAGQLTLTQQDAPQALAKLYERVRDEVALKRSTMSLGVLLVELSHGDKWKATTPRGIDFTRGDKTDDITQRMDDAINAENFKPHTSHYIEPPGREHVVNIAGLDFPVMKIDSVPYPRTHVVTENGYLVDLTKEVFEHIADYVKSGKPISELTLEVADGAPHLAQFMDKKYFTPVPPGAAKSTEPGEEVRRSLAKHLKHMMHAATVDGAQIPQTPHGANSRPLKLFCLDMDLMTGLLMKKREGEDKSELAVFKEAIDHYSQQHGNSIKKIIDLIPADAHPAFHDLSLGDQEAERRRVRLAIQNKLMEIAAHLPNEREAEMVEKAAIKLSEVLEGVYESADKAFVGQEGRKQPPAKPSLYITQGGVGSGKGGLKKLAKKECGDSLVVASLDDMRGDSERLWLYPALNLHHDDYKSICDFGNAVRDLTVQRAKEGGYHLLIDGTGIPYENRNDLVVKDFRDRGFHVSVLGAQAPLSIYEREGERTTDLYDVVTMRGGARLQSELRAVPMSEVAKKHHGHPIAAHDAARDANIDRHFISDTSPAYKESYTLSYVIDVPRPVFDAGLGQLEDKPLKEALGKAGLIPDWVVWPDKLPGEDNIPEGMTKSDLKVIGVKHGATNDQDIYHVEVLINMPQYVNMVQKGLYNAKAEGPEALFDNHIACDIDSVFKSAERGRLRLQPALGLEKVEWPVYTPPLASSPQWSRGKAGAFGLPARG